LALLVPRLLPGRRGRRPVVDEVGILAPERVVAVVADLVVVELEVGGAPSLGGEAPLGAGVGDRRAGGGRRRVRPDRLVVGRDRALGDGRAPRTLRALGPGGRRRRGSVAATGAVDGAGRGHLGRVPVVVTRRHLRIIDLAHG